jgi:4-hydroxybenzoate polyprenyltransferase/phosphoserine phosphatase
MQGVTFESSGDGTVVCADVDGTVLATDLLYESLLVALKRRPWIIFIIPFWLLQGRAVLKARLADRATSLRFESLPLREEVVAYLKQQRERGSRVILASASHHTLVAGIARRLGSVDSIVASDEHANRKGAAKADAIEAHIGSHSWSYIGDSQADFPVWRRSQHQVCVSSSSAFTGRFRREFPDGEVISVTGASVSTWLRGMRIHQWLKNILVFLPVGLAHRWFDIQAIWNSALAAVAFSLCASGVYVLNDLLDLESDRQHPRKRKRPCASGELPLSSAILVVPLLFVSAFVVAALVHTQFMALLGLYLVLTTLYSLRFKALALVDIILLAMLYTIRIVGGGVASNIEVSQWLMGLSMFLFLSLACVKRFSELLVLQQRNEKKTWGRGYWVGDLEQIAAFGAASGYISVLVLALYVSSHEIARLYSHPALVWLACPLLLYWISRIWLLARRGIVHDDPLVFALRDKVTYIVAALGVIILVAAKYSRVAW